MTAEAEIDGWFTRGVEQGAAYMLVVCDTFGYDDYPVYVTTASECWAKYKAPGEMQRVMEVYDLTADKAAQMKETRAMRLPPNAQPSRV